MTGRRLVQNFGGLRAVVVGPVPESLQAGLLRLGLTLTELPGQGSALQDTELRADQDVLFLDGDTDVPAMLAALTGEPLPVPVVGLVGIEAPSRLRALMVAGATAFLRKPIHGGTIYSALFLGINEFRRREQAEALLAEQERRRRGRRHLISAVLRLVQRDGLGEDEAYETLRRDAMRARLGIEDYCEIWMQRAGNACGPSAAITREKRDHA